MRRRIIGRCFAGARAPAVWAGSAAAGCCPIAACCDGGCWGVRSGAEVDASARAALQAEDVRLVEGDPGGRSEAVFTALWPVLRAFAARVVARRPRRRRGAERAPQGLFGGQPSST